MQNQISFQKLCASEMFWRYVWIFRYFLVLTNMCTWGEKELLDTALLSTAFVEHKYTCQAI